MDKALSRRRFSALALAAMSVPVVAVRPRVAAGRQDGGTPAATGGPADALAAMEGQVFSTGPNGEQPTPASEVQLTEAELEQIRGMNATAAIVMHYGGNDWSVAQIAGLKD